MMLITPIASAFDHCSVMGIVGHLSESQNLAVTAPIEDGALLNSKGMLNGDNAKTVEPDCQTSNSCTFHACSGCAITSSVSTVDTVISLYYSHFEYFPPYDTDLSPDLRPPIIVL